MVRRRVFAGVRLLQLGWGCAYPSVVACPSSVCALVPVVAPSPSVPRPLVLPLPGPLLVSCPCAGSLPVPCPCGRLPANLGLSSPPCRGVFSLPLPFPCSCAFPSRSGGGGLGEGPAGRRWLLPRCGWSEATGGGLRGFLGCRGPGPRPGGGLSMPPAAWRPPGRPRWGWLGCGCECLRKCAPCAPLLAFPLPRPTSPSGGAPARRGQTTRRGGRGPGGGEGTELAVLGRRWQGWGWGMCTGDAGKGKLTAVHGGRGTSKKKSLPCLSWRA